MLYTRPDNCSDKCGERGGLQVSKGRVLVVDDDEDIRQLVSRSLADRGYDVALASSGEEGIAAAFTDPPDLVILDVEMPGMDGIQTCQEMRKRLLVPIIFLSVRSDDTDVVLGLGVGGDNYLTKPFRVPELIAHVDAAIRRESLYSERRRESQHVKVRDLTLDASAHELRRNGDAIPLTNTEFKLIFTLACNAGRVVTRDQLLDSVWENKSDGIYSRTVDVHIGRIRRKIEPDPKSPCYIQTISGLGYKMPK